MFVRTYTARQSGKRPGYAVPTYLAQASCLEAFCTDWHSSHQSIRFVQQVWPVKWQSRKLKRLS